MFKSGIEPRNDLLWAFLVPSAFFGERLPGEVRSAGSGGQWGNGGIRRCAGVFCPRPSGGLLIELQKNTFAVSACSEPTLSPFPETPPKSGKRKLLKRWRPRRKPRPRSHSQSASSAQPRKPESAGALVVSKPIRAEPYTRGDCIRGPGVALGLVTPFERALRTVLRGASRGFAAVLMARLRR